MWHSLSCQSMLEEQPVTVHPGIADKPPLKYWWSFLETPLFSWTNPVVCRLNYQVRTHSPSPLPSRIKGQGTRNKKQETRNKKQEKENDEF